MIKCACGIGFVFGASYCSACGKRNDPLASLLSYCQSISDQREKWMKHLEALPKEIRAHKSFSGRLAKSKTMCRKWQGWVEALEKAMERSNG